MESQFSQTLKWLPNLVAFLAACYGIAFQRSVLQSSRPLLPTNSETRPSDRAYARLWDDPFVVFPQDANPPNKLRTRPLDDNPPTLLAFVLLGGLRYAEDDELRLRSRFAVQKALADLDYVPENPEVLETLPYPNYLKCATDPQQKQGPQQVVLKNMEVLRTSDPHDFENPRNPCGASEKSRETAAADTATVKGPGIPFQDFRLRAINRFADTNHSLEKTPPAGSRLQFGRVRVFWLDENALSEEALAKLPKQLSIHKWDFAEPGKAYPLSIALFGPSNSAALTEMVSLRSQDLQSLESDPEQQSNCAYPTEAFDPSADIRVINYQATAANDYIKLFAYHQQHLSQVYNKTIEAVLENIRPELEQPLLSVGTKNTIHIERAGCSDYQLCEALLGEVHRRTPFFIRRRPKILIFYETDTFYGRALALTLETLAKYPYPAHPSPQSEQLLARLFSGSKQRAPFRVDLIGYFRGLDGFSTYYHKQYVSAQEGSANDAKGSSAESGSTSKSTGLDHGEGPLSSTI
jgi:hypothetical protein